ncbi:MAG: 50S ribosomal protein L20 [Ignavibacteriaceae bacterium]|nr:50S ribosomal protein L20 [Ignavibacteriaceae bacterium]
MPRSKNKVASHRRRKKLLAKAKGYWGARKNVLTVAKTHVEKGLVHAYRDRKLKKRNYRNLWVVRINAAIRPFGISYSKFINALKVKGVVINRKILAQLSTEHPNAFAELVNFVQK